MRPHLDARARRAAVTLGALGTACIATATPPLVAHAIPGATPRRPAPASPGPARHLLDGPRLLLAGRPLGPTPGQPGIGQGRPRHRARRPPHRPQARVA